MLTITRAQARRFVLLHHGLLGERKAYDLASRHIPREILYAEK